MWLRQPRRSGKWDVVYANLRELIIPRLILTRYLQAFVALRYIWPRWKRCPIKLSMGIDAVNIICVISAVFS